MLAYVFWHRPRPEVDRDRYEAAVVDYHRVLGSEALDGVHGSASYRVDAVPWLGEGACYEDWYRLEGSYAIDILDLAAVSGRLTEPHRAVASLCGEMTAGLYELRLGEPAGGGTAAWFRKAAGETYDELYARLAGKGALWRRRMVLGPTPEFCLVGPLAAEIPDAAVVRRERLVAG